MSSFDHPQSHVAFTHVLVVVVVCRGRVGVVYGNVHAGAEARDAAPGAGLAAASTPARSPRRPQRREDQRRRQQSATLSPAYCDHRDVDWGSWPNVIVRHSGEQGN